MFPLESIPKLRNCIPLMAVVVAVVKRLWQRRRIEESKKNSRHDRTKDRNLGFEKRCSWF